MPWFAVKTFLRSRPVGRPKGRDKHYQGGLAAVEERIVIFRAKNGDSAIKKGRLEAQKYARLNRATNVYGQAVVTELLRYVEAFEMFDDPRDGAEVFSSIEVVTSTESASSIVERKIGEASDASTTRQFIASWISELLDEEGINW